MVLDFLDFSIFLTFHKIQNCRPHKTPNKPSLVLTWLLQFWILGIFWIVWIFLTFQKIQNCRPHQAPSKQSLVLTWLLQFRIFFGGKHNRVNQGHVFHPNVCLSFSRSVAMPAMHFRHLLPSPPYLPHLASPTSTSTLNTSITKTVSYIYICSYVYIYTCIYLLSIKKIHCVSSQVAHFFVQYIEFITIMNILFLQQRSAKRVSHNGHG